MDWPSIRVHVLSHFSSLDLPNQPEGTLVAPGFSGASVWRLECRQRAFCLRAWPVSMRDGSRLNWIHATLTVLCDAGAPPVPRPLTTDRGGTWVKWDDRFWEISSWLPGRADYREHPSPQRLHSTLTTLAQFHAETARVVPPGVTQLGSPALQQRWSILCELREGLMDRLRFLLREGAAGPWRELGLRIMHHCQMLLPQLTAQVAHLLSVPVPLQICHGDLWHDHVLFLQEQVSGFIDFGNLRVESPTSDLARLLGSLAGSEYSCWQAGLEAYERLHPLTPTEHHLLAVLDQTGVLLSGVNWLRWILIERREFNSWARVEHRLGAIVARLDRFPVLR